MGREGSRSPHFSPRHPSPHAFPPFSAAKAAQWEANLKQKERDQGSLKRSVWAIPNTFKSLLKSF